ncbi:bZIP transcription factor 11-like [Salvia splendens]|uniref:bZIP transcription factor 11-like n=1 Tax=Salvia splendens TaxID=180675 RepID=UPI001C265E51|nr:bZIP transcription factor 11-like [Salvia splendens]
MKMDSLAPPCSSTDVQQRKQRRMESNRESARVKKQKYVDDLTAEAAHLSELNNQISNSMNATVERYEYYSFNLFRELLHHFVQESTMQQCVKIEVHNSVLRAQIMELSHRLHSFKQILTHHAVFEADHLNFGHGLLNNSWNLLEAPHH